MTDPVTDTVTDTVTHHPLEEYDGPAEALAVPADGETTGPTGLVVQTRLRGHFEPIDGRFHWWGRLSASAELDSTHRAGDEIVLRTAHGEARAKLSDVDPWGRFRVTGEGRPPF